MKLLTTAAVLFVFLILIECKARRRNKGKVKNDNNGNNGEGTNTHCVDKCKNRDNGNYQSCNGCNVYVTCINGQMIDNRPCAGGTEWDDIQRTCVAPGNSTTCSSGVTPPPQPSPPTHPPKDILVPTNPPGEGIAVPEVGTCLSSCTGIRNGNYKSCLGCTMFIQCTHGNTHDGMSCPVGVDEHGNKTTLQWDDVEKVCVHNSSTCGNFNYTGPTGGGGGGPIIEEGMADQDCQVRTEHLREKKIDNCVADVVERTSCSGNCGVSREVYLFDHTTELECSCCRVVENTTSVIFLQDCTVGPPTKLYTYTKITKCQCLPCPAPV